MIRKTISQNFHLKKYEFMKGTEVDTNKGIQKN